MQPLLRRWLERIAGGGTPPGSGPAKDAAPSAALDQISRPDSGLAAFGSLVTAATTAEGRPPSSPLPNSLETAFTPLHPVSTPSRFVGRRAALRRLVEALDHEQSHALVCGERGIGKTSMLKAVAALAKEAGHLPIAIPCSDSLSFDELIRYIAEAIPLLYHKSYSPLEMSGRAEADFSTLLSASPATVTAASRLLSNVTGIRILILLDEFQRVCDPAFPSQIAQLMKNLSDADANVQFVISGTAGQARDLFNDPEALGRGVVTVQLPRLEDEAVGRLITDRSVEAGVAFDHDAVELIVRAARGLPSMVGLLSYHAAALGADAGASSISLTEVMGALSTLAERAQSRISTIALRQLETQLDPDVRRALSELAGGNAQGDFLVDSDRLAPLFDASRAERITAAIASLADHTMLIERRGASRYAFLEPSVSEYLWLLQALDDGAALARGEDRPSPQTVGQIRFRDE